MASLEEYFLANRYTGIYDIGDRVRGRWNGIPFMGSIGNDSVVSEYDGPRLSIHLDLPIKYENVIYNHIIAKHKDVERLPTSVDKKDKK